MRLQALTHPSLASIAGHHHATWTAFLLLCSVGLLLLLAKLITSITTWRRRSSRVSCTYVPWDQSSLVDSGAVIVCDCTHPKAPTFSHHKGHRNPHGLKAADTSTGIVLNALMAGRGLLGSEASAYLQRQFVTTNHFDIDSFLSVWCFINRDLAMQHWSVLQATARIGDFREALLSPELVSKHGWEDGIANVREAFTALKLACWINTLERQLFTAPYESKDCQQKFEYFLPVFATVLQDPESQWSVWQEEYKQVVTGFDQLQGPGCSVEVHKEIGLAVLRCPEPLHYYSLFSHTCGCDYVLTMYGRNRYELECKYTQFVQVHSRPVVARLDLTALATVLNSMEQDQPEGTFWVSPRFTDTGPVLRLERATERLSKAQRYGHPTGRPINQSTLPPEMIIAVVVSFLEFGLQGCRPRRGGFSWDELQRLNQGLQWSLWVNAVLDQHDKGELGSRTSLGERSRRMSMEAIAMEPSTSAPALLDRSAILTDQQVRLLAGTALPPHLSFGSWRLAYSTNRDGFSLHTLYRKAAGKPCTVLVMQDSGGNVFGAYAPEPWKVHPRFYGTGETSVFQLHPRQLLWRWSPLRGMTDFFQFSTHEGLGVGGSGAFALWVDNDLFEGSSAACNTFASPCLACTNHFQVQILELWHVV